MNENASCLEGRGGGFDLYSVLHSGHGKTDHDIPAWEHSWKLGNIQ